MASIIERRGIWVKQSVCGVEEIIIREANHGDREDERTQSQISRCRRKAKIFKCKTSHASRTH